MSYPLAVPSNARRFGCARTPRVAGFALVIGLAPGAAPAQGPDMRLGSPDLVINGGFTRVTSVRELHDHKLLIADRIEGIAVTDLRSGATRTIGRRGDGPGEYRGVGRIHVLGGDSSLFTDSDSHRWLIMDGVSIVRTLPAHLAPNRLLSSLLSGADRFGHVLGVRGFRHTPGVPASRETADSLLVLLVHLPSQRVDTITRVKGRGPAGFGTLPARGGSPPRIFLSNPLATEEQALLFADGWIAIARTNPYRVDWRAPDGRWIRGPALPFDSVKVDRRQQCAAMARRTPALVRDRCDPSQPPGWPEILPPFPSSVVPTLFPAPDGTLVIARTPDARERRRFHDVVDREGRLVGRFALQQDHEIVGVGAASVYAVATDTLGIQALHRYPWPAR